MLYTLRDISGLIADCESRPEEPIFNQLKGLAGRSILAPVADRYGKKGALLFPQGEVYRARMLLAALDIGFASEKIAKFDAQLRFDRRVLNPISGEHYSPSLKAAIADLTAEKRVMWVFEVGRGRVEGEMDFSGHWIADGKRIGKVPDWSKPSPGFEGVITFAFTNLSAPLYGAMKAEE